MPKEFRFEREKLDAERLRWDSVTDETCNSLRMLHESRTCASRWKRARRLGSPAEGVPSAPSARRRDGALCRAADRPRPCPLSATRTVTSYGPRRVPGVRRKGDCADHTAATSRSVKTATITVIPIDNWKDQERDRFQQSRPTSHSILIRVPSGNVNVGPSRPPSSSAGVSRP